MRIRYIEVFLALMQAGSTQGAAELLCTTQSSVSKLLQSLERQLGFPLFLRSSGSKLKPTADAYALMASAGRINGELQAFMQLAGELQAGQAVHLNVQSAAAVATSLLPRVVARYKRNWHDLKINLTVGRPDGIVSSVRNHQADIGIIITPSEHEIPMVHNVWSAPMVCVFQKGHALAAKPEIRPGDLAGLPFIAYRASQGLGRIVENAFASAGVVPQVEIRANSTGMICRIVEEGYGVSVVDRLSLSINEGLEYRPFLPECLMRVGIVVSERVALSIQGQRFVDTLKSCLLEIR